MKPTYTIPEWMYKDSDNISIDSNITVYLNNCGPRRFKLFQPMGTSNGNAGKLGVFITIFLREQVEIRMGLLHL